MTTNTTRETNDAPSWRVLHNRHTDERLQLRRVIRDGQLCLELKGSVPPRADGPPLHVHYCENEEGTVIAGTLSAEVNGRTIEVGPGGAALLPMGSAHRWWNGGDETLVFEGFARPVADLDVYLAATFDIVNSGPRNRPPLFYLAHLAWRHRKTQALLFAPRWLRTVLVPAIVLLGTLLGRYRGTDWPGCPARCMAAPLEPTSDERRDLRDRRAAVGLA
jgi:quercetin dioxygenase-like cupin family protein